MLPAIATKKDLTVNGRIYPVIEAGEGPLVVCLHGFPDNYESFQHQIEPFVAAGYRIVCPMMPFCTGNAACYRQQYTCLRLR